MTATALDCATTPDHHEIRAATRRVARASIAPHAADVDRCARFPQEAMDALAAEGLHAPHIPVTYGGRGADTVGTCIVIEEVARACMSSSLIPGGNKLGSTGLLLSASPELRAQVLPDIAAGGLISYALSEREAGSDAASMRTRARAGNGGWVLDGTKAWITNAGSSIWYTVMAVTDPSRGPHGISAFAVHADDPGISVGVPERKMGIKGSPTREVYFTDCTIPADRIIGEPGTGFQTALLTLDHTRPAVGAQAVGLAQGALDAAQAFVRADRAAAASQVNQFALADMAMQILAARNLVYLAAAHADRRAPGLGFVSAAAKCFASDTAMAVTSAAVDVFGRAGADAAHPVERMLRDAKITQIYEGTNQIQRLVMGRALLAP